MVVWIVSVTHYSKIKPTIVDIVGYKTYDEAKKEITSKIKDLKIINDYKFIDMENEIGYELKSIFVK